MARLHFSDPNTARSRITELLQTGLLREHGHTINTTTKKKVRVCSPTTPYKAQLSLHLSPLKEKTTHGPQT